MKKIFSTLFTIILLLCVAVPARADFAVTSITLSANDLDASAFFPVLDNYKRQCALIKVQVDPPQGGFLFETGALGVEKVVEKLPEIWVYVPEKTMKIKIMHPKLGVISNSQNNDGYYWFHDKVGKLESGRVYVLKLALNKQVIENIVDVKKESGFLILQTEPEGAAVWIGKEGEKQEYCGVTPFQKYMEYGRYMFRLKKAKYHDEIGVAEVNKKRVKLDVMNMRPAFGSVYVTSNPSGAAVMLDGESTGKVTPCTIEEVKSGEHEIQLYKENYTPVVQNVTIIDGQTIPMDISLAARFAQVTITTLPGASIKINGALKGTSSYTEELMEGIYEVDVTLANHRSATKQIEVVAGVPQSVELNPTPIFGSLEIITTPMDATITINGKDYGITPIVLDNLLIGEYDVVLSKTGCATVTEHVTISENATAAINATLPSIMKPKWSANITPEQKKILSQLIDNMVKVEGGTFMMGATSEQGDDAFDWEKPAHQVTLSSYYINKFEVTCEEWYTVTGDKPSFLKEQTKTLQLLADYNPMSKHPATNINWNECQNFIRKLNELTGLTFSLPTEAQWEFAARGGNNSKGYKYSGSNNLNEVAWYQNNSNSTEDVSSLHTWMELDGVITAPNQTRLTGRKKPNELGLYDMSGNVWEWCSDWHGIYSSGTQTNPTGAYSGSGRVCRGGGWGNLAKLCRVSCRFDLSPNDHNNGLGLRLALNIAE